MLCVRLLFNISGYVCVTLLAKRPSVMMCQQKKDVRMLRFIQEVNTTTRSCALWDLAEETDYIVHVQSISMSGPMSQHSEPLRFRTPKESETQASKSKGKKLYNLTHNFRIRLKLIHTVSMEETKSKALLQVPVPCCNTGAVPKKEEETLCTAVCTHTVPRVKLAVGLLTTFD